MFEHEGCELKENRRVKLIFNLLQPVITDCLYNQDGTLRVDLEKLICSHTGDVLKTKFRLYAGEQQTIPLQQSELFTELLRKSGFEAELVSGPGDSRG